MRRFAFVIPLAVAAICAVLVNAATPTPPNTYIPQAQFCFPQAMTPPATSPLCPVVPGNISPDPVLDGKLGYRGLVGANPTSPMTDVESPFDNYSWQVFVGLNWKWTDDKTPPPPPNIGLKSDGIRVWQHWSRVSKVFGDSKVLAKCIPGIGEEVFQIASNGNGTTAIRNEEYIQAATGEPVIDTAGNWTLYERRVNDIEIGYLKKPSGNPQWDLTRLFSQQQFVANKQVVNFPAIAGTPTGAMEIKAAWRILDPAQHAINAKKYYVISALVAVAPDLVARPAGAPAQPICAHVDLGLVAMHIMQKNVDTHNLLLPKWFWTTFEHVDNAPDAAKPCDVTAPQNCQPFDTKSAGGNLCPPANPLPPGSPNYAYYNAGSAPLPVNQPPTPHKGDKAFLWNPTMPFAKGYLIPDSKGHPTGTQVSRCWGIYTLTKQINTQWQQQLRAVGSVFANYEVIGTQWGGRIEPRSSAGPEDAAPNFLSNSVVETYLQKNFIQVKGQPVPFATGSCVSCHTAAILTVKQAGAGVPSDLSFLPGLVQLLQTRRPPVGAPGHDTNVLQPSP